VEEVMIEHVWVVPDLALAFVQGLALTPHPAFQGFAQCDNSISCFLIALRRAAGFMPRPLAETDTSHKQVIPYVVVTSEGRYLTYERSGGNEERLNSKFSIGVGGHVNPEDDQTNKVRVLFFAALRELDEELCILEKGCHFPASSVFYDTLMIKGILYDESDEVGRVHVGVVLHADVKPEVAKTIQMISEGKNLAWMTAEELRALEERLEGWSRKSLRALEAGAVGCSTSLRDLSEE
jgi:predicted NUDIX family phosphoesterase